MDTRQTKTIKLSGSEHKEVRTGGKIVWSGLRSWNKYSTADEDYYITGGLAETSSSLSWVYAEMVKFNADTGVIIQRSGFPATSLRVGDGIGRDYKTSSGAISYLAGIVSERPTTSTSAVPAFLYGSVSLSTRKVKSDFVNTIEATEGTYPENGVHTDGFWYELVV